MKTQPSCHIQVNYLGLTLIRLVFQVRDLEDAVQELWRRRDKADQDLIASLRAAAGLPTQQEIFAITPYSDDEDEELPVKKEYGHSIKFSLKGLANNSPKKNNKKPGNKKYKFGRIEHSDAQSIGSITGDNKDEEANLTDGVDRPVDRPELLKLKLVNVVDPSKTDHRSSRHKMKSQRSSQLDETEIKPNNTKTKLVIHLGGRNKNVVNSPSKSIPELTTSKSKFFFIKFVIYVIENCIYGPSQILKIAGTLIKYYFKF